MSETGRASNSFPLSTCQSFGAEARNKMPTNDDFPGEEEFDPFQNDDILEEARDISLSAPPQSQ